MMENNSVQLRKKNQQGYTLMEIMVTLAIVGIVAAIVVPNLNSFFTNIRLKGATRALHAALIQTKIYAMKTQVEHTLLLGGTSGTQQGWITFCDVDNNGTLSGGETIIENFTLTDNITLLNANLGSAITFQRMGLLNRGTATYTLESTEFSKQQTLTVSPTGYVTIN